MSALIANEYKRFEDIKNIRADGRKALQGRGK